MFLASCGLVTPVGLSFPAATAAMRAGVAAFDTLPYHDGLGKNVVGAQVPFVAEGWRGLPRLLHLMVPAIRECLESAGIDDPSSVPLLINVSERDAPGRPRDLEQELPELLAGELGSLHPRSLLLRAGRVGAADSLAQARELFAAGLPRCVIAGVDSLISAGALQAFAGKQRLKTEMNPDGLIPGEAAGAILVEAVASQPHRVRIAGIGFGTEPVTPDSDEPVLGQGLANALRQALGEAGIDIADAACRLSDLTGEKYYFLEANFALGRLLRRRKLEFPLWHPMDSIGDSGAAAGFCLLAVALASFMKGYALGKTVLCQMSAEGGRRAAVVVSAES
jgi:3-oxoacyl-[acyl-carrier-protein] synthase I